ncbi:uncharacterized protein LOC126896421 [Daktulosphaira vitifoliae]|uniref:uncharacterized protein LOC126896421 n=1 Tax=Daktulosphaira vitifoliae TaxID=58002 RepID=UPI0021AA45CF|nr:uncharacterized protein LOC126896421 [Daktulosphaira vitifoliae]
MEIITGKKSKLAMSKSSRYRLKKKATNVAEKLLNINSKDINHEILQSTSHQVISNMDYCASVSYINISKDQQSENDILHDLLNSPDRNEYLNANFYSDYSDDEHINPHSSFTETPDIKLILALWSIRNNITHAALNDLLKCLKCFPPFSDLPIDSRTILKTPKTTVVKPISDGIYHYFGITQEVKCILYSNKNLFKEFLLVVGIDGLPLMSNPPSQLWPIFGYFSNIDFLKKSVFIIGAYYGTNKPKDCNEYLLDFVEELKHLYNEGIIFNNEKYTVKLDALIADSPAKSFVLNCKGHTGKNSCVKCLVEGVWLNHRIHFSDLDAELRSHEHFSACLYEDFHQGHTILTEVSYFDMISSVPYDYMHVILIGVVKKLLLFWTTAHHYHCLSSHTIKSLDENLIFLSQYIPDDFQRNPNSRNHPLKDVNRWKATELRQCILYTGLVLFQNKVQSDIYTHFLGLSVALRILLTENIEKQYYDYAKSLLRNFVTAFGDLYGLCYVSHNIHALIHITSDAEKYGSLEKISAFPFENFMQPIKKKVRSGVKPLQQIIRRYKEHRAYSISFSNSKKEPYGPIWVKCDNKNRPLVSGVGDSQYSGWRTPKFTIKLNKANCCVKLKNNLIMVIDNIATCLTSKKTIIIGRCFEKIENYFIHPCNSSLLGIYKVSKKGPLHSFSIDIIQEKLVCLPLDLTHESMVVIPFVHSV